MFDTNVANEIEDNNIRLVNNNTYRKPYRADRWTEDENAKFFDVRILRCVSGYCGADDVRPPFAAQCLSQFGTDFEMIARLFQNRTRSQIRAKWNKEERANPHKITLALKTKKPIGAWSSHGLANLSHGADALRFGRTDMALYSAITGKDFSGPMPEDPFEKIQRRRREETAAKEDSERGRSQSQAKENMPSTSFQSGAGPSSQGKRRGRPPKNAPPQHETVIEEEDEDSAPTPAAPRQQQAGSDDDDDDDDSDDDDEEDEEARRRAEEDAALAAL